MLAKKTNKELDDEETTNQFTQIMKEFSDPVEIKKRKFLKKRQDLISDKKFDYGL